MSLETARIATPLRDSGRSLGWWGAALGLFILAHFVGGMHVAAVYLRAFTETWPPAAVEPPGPEPAIVAAVLVVVAALAVTVGARRIATGVAERASPLAPAAFGVAGGAALIACGVRAWGSLFAGHPITEHAFWSMHWTLGAVDSVLFLVLAIMATMTAVHIARGVIRPGRHAEVTVVLLWAWVTAVFGVVSLLVFSSVSIWWG